MKQHLIDNLGGYFARECQSSGGLAILPIFSNGAPIRDYISLHKALEQGAVVISEISEGGSVPNLKVQNRGDKAVLLLDGEELRGAKQNRVLNASILVAPNSELIIPVSCVERGRWGYRGREFSESGNVLPSRQKIVKNEDMISNLKTSGEYRSNQGRVWDEIDRMQMEHDTPSPTSAMDDVYRARGQDLDELCAAFPLLEGQIGIYAEIGGQFAGLDLVSRPEVWRDLQVKVVRSYAIDAVTHPVKAHTIDAGKLDKLFGRLADCDFSSFKSVGIGEDIRLEHDSLIGSALFWENALIHLAVYPRRHRANPERYDSPRNRGPR